VHLTSNEVFILEHDKLFEAIKSQLGHINYLNTVKAKPVMSSLDSAKTFSLLMQSVECYLTKSSTSIVTMKAMLLDIEKAIHFTVFMLSHRNVTTKLYPEIAVCDAESKQPASSDKITSEDACSILYQALFSLVTSKYYKTFTKIYPIIEMQKG
jgi:hypothetical protein